MNPGDRVKIVGPVPDDLRRFVGQVGTVETVIGQKWVRVAFAIPQTGTFDVQELVIVGPEREDAGRTP